MVLPGQNATDSAMFFIYYFFLKLIQFIYKSLFTIQYGRNDNEKKQTKKHLQQTITHYDSDITCPEISSDDEQAGHSANQSKTLPDI